MRGFIFLVPFTLLTACSQAAQTPSQSELCQQTVLDYATFRDDPTKSSDYANLFTEDGQFKMGSNQNTGRNALINRHKAANKNTIFNHIMDGIEINSDLTGTSRVVVYTKNKSDADNINRVIIADYTDKFEMVDGKCLIANRKVSVVFDTSAARIIPADKN